MKFRILYLALLVILVLLGIGWFIFRSNPAEETFQIKKHLNEPVFQLEGKIYFMSDAGNDTLSVLDIEIVENTKDIMQGLMYRSHLKPDQGMFFIFPEEEEEIFWMKDTRLSLDIIFVNNDLKIIHIARHTVPYSTEPIPSIYPAKYAVEVNAGYTDTHRIQELDYLRYDVIK